VGCKKFENMLSYFDKAHNCDSQMDRMVTAYTALACNVLYLKNDF